MTVVSFVSAPSPPVKGFLVCVCGVQREETEREEWVGRSHPTVCPDWWRVVLGSCVPGRRRSVPLRVRSPGFGRYTETLTYSVRKRLLTPETGSVWGLTCDVVRVLRPRMVEDRVEGGTSRTSGTVKRTV